MSPSLHPLFVVVPPRGSLHPTDDCLGTRVPLGLRGAAVVNLRALKWRLASPFCILKLGHFNYLPVARFTSKGAAQLWIILSESHLGWDCLWIASLVCFMYHHPSVHHVLCLVIKIYLRQTCTISGDISLVFPLCLSLSIHCSWQQKFLQDADLCTCWQLWLNCLSSSDSAVKCRLNAV